MLGAVGMEWGWSGGGVGVARARAHGGQRGGGAGMQSAGQLTCWPLHVCARTGGRQSHPRPCHGPARPAALPPATWGGAGRRARSLLALLKYIKYYVSSSTVLVRRQLFRIRLRRQGGVLVFLPAVR